LIHALNAACASSTRELRVVVEGGPAIREKMDVKWRRGEEEGVVSVCCTWARKHMLYPVDEITPDRRPTKSTEDAFSPMVQEIKTNKKRKAWPGRWDLADATPVDYRQKGQRSDGTSSTKAEKLPRS
jgi:hypothetical protein